MKNSLDDLGCGGIILVILLTIALIMLLMWLTMLLWNELIPALFNGPTLTYWQTFGLWTLCCTFFKAINLDDVK